MAIIDQCLLILWGWTRSLLRKYTKWSFDVIRLSLVSTVGLMKSSPPAIQAIPSGPDACDLVERAISLEISYKEMLLQGDEVDQRIELWRAALEIHLRSLSHGKYPLPW
jgi:hypothetical protein